MMMWNGGFGIDAKRSKCSLEKTRRAMALLQPSVRPRGGQDVEVHLHVLHAANLGDPLEQFAFLVPLRRHSADQRDHPVVHAAVDQIPDPVVGVSPHRAAHLLCKALLILFRRDDHLAGDGTDAIDAERPLNRAMLVPEGADAAGERRFVADNRHLDGS